MIYCLEAVNIAYKVGYSSTELSSQLSVYRSCCPVDLLVVFQFEGSPVAKSTIHRLLEPWKTRGDWFSLEAAPTLFRLRDELAFRAEVLQGSLAGTGKRIGPRPRRYTERREIPVSDDQWRKWKQVAASLGVPVEQWIAEVVDRATAPPG